MATLGLSAVAAQRPANAEPFLLSNGARGLLAEEEDRLYRLRQEKEGEARKALNEERLLLEEENRKTQAGKLCATPFGIDVVGITELLLLVGALVGGTAARQRKAEVERLNEQLRKINMSLRQQARAGTLYAPGLTYAPPVTQGPGGAGPSVMPMPPASPVAAAAPPIPPAAYAAAAAMSAGAATATATSSSKAPSAAGVTILSMEEEEMTPDQLALKDALRTGKRQLKEGNGARAMVLFEKALMLSKAVQDKVQERRAQRGLAASARLQGQYKQSIKHLECVLRLSREMKDYTGDADAYGVIADCYTDMGDFDKAALYYDKYIERMSSSDGPL